MVNHEWGKISVAFLSDYQRVSSLISSQTLRLVRDPDLAMARQAGIPWKERRASDPRNQGEDEREKQQSRAPLLLLIDPNEL
jgi:hypothetical protein